MSLREVLAKPLAFEPLARDNHTHTVIFLHRYPQDTTEKALISKVLSARYTKDTRSLRLEFPTVRWVYPYPKLTGTHGAHWTGLDDHDIVILELESGHELPYITQIILQEAKRVGGLEKIIVGGQGETAVAAHEAMCRLPELTRELRNDPEKVKQFLRNHLGFSGDAIGDLRFGGYVGMHPDKEQLTRDERSYSLMSRLGGGSNSISNITIANTPHLFIRGGYQDATAIWGGQRIDDFAVFLDSTVGVFRSSSTSETMSSSSPAAPSSSSNTIPGSLGPQLEADFVADPAQRRAASLASQRDLAAQRKHAENARRAKRAEESYRKVLRGRIEMDKRDRTAVFAQRRQNRLEAERDAVAAAAAAAAAGPSSSEQQHAGVFDTHGHGQLSYDEDYDEEEDYDDEEEEYGGDGYVENHYGPGHSDSQRWLPPQPRGSMTTQRMMALGVYEDKTEGKTEDKNEGETVKNEGGH